MNIFQQHRIVAVVSGLVFTGATTAGLHAATEHAAVAPHLRPAHHSAAVPAAIMRAPHAQPAIFQIVLPNEEVHSGQTVHAAVLTSSNVASVEARIKGMAMNLNHAGVGKFTLTYQVPWLPFFFRGDWPVNIIARNVDGVRAERTLKIKYQ